jgi:glycosyltransferase involved in cell wall biosynthesis
LKIFFVQTASKIDYVVKKDLHLLEKLNFEQIIKYYSCFGFISLFGIGGRALFDKNGDLDIFANVTNAKFIQKIWARENNVTYNEANWEKEILAAQIEKFKPDVIYTGNHSFFTKEIKQYLPKAKLYALWNASPMKEGIDLNHFDVGVSFNEVYHNNLKKRGIKSTEYNSFYIDPILKNKLDNMNLKQEIDISFVGRYAPMFKERNQFLYDVYEEFKDDFNIKYYLLTGSRLRGLIPLLPWKLLKVYNKPIFLKDMFKVFKKSKIVLNTHSNITGKYKGNMRVFEALGSGSFMLSDDGVYPENLIAGEDFVVYKNNKDMKEKIEYYLKHDNERVEIAFNGQKKIYKYYNVEIGARKLEKIFANYF